MDHSKRKIAIKILKTKFGNICWYCGICLDDREFHVDHIHPKSKGGGDDILNLALACAMCNRAKHNKDLRTFISWIYHIKTRGFEPKIHPDGQHPLSRLY